MILRKPGLAAGLLSLAFFGLRRNGMLRGAFQLTALSTKREDIMRSRWSNPIPQALQQHGGISKHPVATSRDDATAASAVSVDIVDAWDRLDRRFSGFASSPIPESE